MAQQLFFSRVGARFATGERAMLSRARAHVAHAVIVSWTNCSFATVVAERTNG